MRGYKKLKDLDRQKLKGIKYSKAFSDFTCLMYANLSELADGFGSGTNSEKAVTSSKVSYH